MEDTKMTRPDLSVQSTRNEPTIDPARPDLGRPSTRVNQTRPHSKEIDYGKSEDHGPESLGFIFKAP